MSRSYLEDAGDAQIEEDEIGLGVIHGITEGPETVRFRVMNPDSRMRLKVTVAFVPADGVAIDLTDQLATLYLGEEEKMKRRGKRVLCTDIIRDETGAVRHQSNPLDVPEDAGLMGFTIEFVTAADSVLGIFAAKSPGDVDGQWFVKARWSPDGQRLCDRDWDQQRRKCRITLLGDEFAGGE